MSIPLLLLRLEAPMMAFGSGASWDFKDTLSFPTKSAIVGLLSAALGFPKGDRRILELSRKIKVSVRIDRRGKKDEDYQIISGDIYTADGKILSGNKTSIRKYIFDASYLIAISGEEDVLISCKKALDDPVWIPFLGRKCCIQSIPLTGKLSYKYNSVEEAFIKEPTCERRDKRSLPFIIEDECGNEEIYDEINGRVGRDYMPRMIRRGVVNI